MGHCPQQKGAELSVFVLHLKNLEKSWEKPAENLHKNCSCAVTMSSIGPAYHQAS
jgi:hypothetical protein